MVPGAAGGLLPCDGERDEYIVDLRPFLFLLDLALNGDLEYFALPPGDLLRYFCLVPLGVILL